MATTTRLARRPGHPKVDHVTQYSGDGVCLLERELP
jgi:hypothetical protein